MENSIKQDIMSYRILLIAAFGVTLAGCQSHNIKNEHSMMSADSTQTFLIQNETGMSALITNYGAKVVSLNVPDRKGQLGDVVFGYDSLSDYLSG